MNWQEKWSKIILGFFGPPPKKIGYPPKRFCSKLKNQSCYKSHEMARKFGGRSENHLLLSPFHAILNKFDFFHFWPKNLYGQQKNFGGGGLKVQKIIFDQFSCHFRQFWTTLIFFQFWQKMLYVPLFFWGGGYPKI